MIRTSASQYKTYEDLCRRKWWLRYVVKLEEPRRSFQVNGTVFHAIIERYEKADATGRDPQTGKAVELYPEGWRTATDRDGNTGTITEEEGKRLQRLFRMGVERGVLWRPPEALVEHEYYHTYEDRAVEHGFVDLLTPDAVRDHKTARTRRYVLNEAEIHADLQLRTYASELRRIRRSKGYPDVPIEVGHNVFTMEPEDAFVRKNVLQPEDLDQHEKKVLTILDGMLELQDVKEADWRQIDVAAQLQESDACNAYGGCPYRAICAGQELPSIYRMRMERVAAAEKRRREGGAMGIRGPGLLALLGKKPEAKEALPPVTSPKEVQEAARTALLAAQGETKVAPAIPFDQPAPVHPPIVASPAPSAPIAPTESARSHTTPQVPPWHNPNCVACRANSHPGFNSAGKPCPVCDASARRAGKPTSAEFHPRVVDGAPTWDPSAPPAPTSPPIERKDVPAPASGDLPAAKRVGRPPGSKNRIRSEEAASVLSRMGELEQANAELAAQLAEASASGAELAAQVAQLRGENAALLEQRELTREQWIEGAAQHGALLATPPAPGEFALLIGVQISRGARDQACMDFSDLLELVHRAMAADSRAASYWELDTWKRRDAIHAKGREIAQALIPAGAWVVAPRSSTQGPDEQALLSALRLHASWVVE